MVFFPLQNPELLRVAPELGGLPLQEAIHGVDSSTREVFAAGGLWVRMLGRLPGWRGLCGRLLSLPALRGAAAAWYGRRSRRWCSVRRGR